jgi:hypothetical protein
MVDALGCRGCLETLDAYTFPVQKRIPPYVGPESKLMLSYA